MLDAATLLIAAVPEDAKVDCGSLRKSRADAKMLYMIGCHALVDLTQLRIAGGISKLAAPSPGIERSEFETACRRLAEAGYPVSAGETAWQVFSGAN